MKPVYPGNLNVPHENKTAIFDIEQSERNFREGKEIRAQVSIIMCFRMYGFEKIKNGLTVLS